MAQTGYTPILIYASGTTTNVPLAANLTSSSSGAELALNYADGKLFYKNSSGVVSLLASTAASATSGSSILYGNGSGGFSNVTIGSGISFASGTLSATGSGGTVTSVAASVPSFLSISGSPITTTGTLAITYSGTALPVANGGTGLTAGTSGGILAYTATGTLASSAALTQYGIVYGGGAGAVPVATAAGTTGQVLTATTSGAPTWATPAAGVSLSANNTWTGTQTFNGSSSVFGAVLTNAAETTTVSATAATGTINYYVNSQSVLYYTTNASANWTLNVAFSAGTSLNTALATGQTVTIAFFVTQGATAYYASAMTIDGTSVTPKWQGGTAPTSGNASSVDVYTYAITKTASATYTVLASQTKFA